MTNSVATTKDFQERLFDKIRADIGSLMTDEDMKKLVHAAFEREFFTPRIEQEGGGYNRREVQKPPRIIEITKELLEPMLRKILDQWIAENHEKVFAAMQKELQDGILTAAERIAAERIRRINETALSQMQNALIEMNQKLVSRGIY